MNKDLIEIPRFNFFIGDEVLLKGKIVGFDVDENKCVENVVRLEYGQTLNVPNSNIYIIDDIVDKSKIKVTIPQCVADWIEYCKAKKITLAHALYHSEEAKNKSVYHWIVEGLGHQESFARAWLDDYEVEKEKRYLVKMAKTEQYLHHVNGHFSFVTYVRPEEEPRLVFSRKELEEANFGWVFDCPGIEVEEVKE